MDTTVKSIKWRKVLYDIVVRCRRPKNKTFTRLKNAAGSWPFCYIGERKHKITSISPFNFCPQDNALYNLGISFAAAVGERKWEKALSIANQIDSRIKELKKKENVND